MRNSFTKILRGASFTLLLTVGQSHAAVIVSNLTDSVGGTGTIFAAGPPQYYAQEFTTGNQSVTLASITAALGFALPSFTASAELVADHGGLPGSTALTDFTVPTIPTSSPTDLILVPTSIVMLGANTNYWFILSASGAGSYQWNFTNTLRASLPNYAVSSDGMTWTIGTPPGPFLIEVDSAAAPATVPEPSSFILVGLASLLGFGERLGRSITRCPRKTI